MVLTFVVALAVSQSLPLGAVGAVFVLKETKTDVELALRFDEAQVVDAPPRPSEDDLQRKKKRPKVPVSLGAPLRLMDPAGELITLEKASFSFQVFCWNDGGIRSQAEARVKVKKADLKRPLISHRQAAGVAALVVVGEAKSTTALAPPPANVKVYVEGDLDGDGKVDARLLGELDEAMGCESAKVAPWSVDLQTHAGKRALRCCGP